MILEQKQLVDLVSVGDVVNQFVADQKFKIQELVYRFTKTLIFPHMVAAGLSLRKINETTQPKGCGYL